MHKELRVRCDALSLPCGVLPAVESVASYRARDVRAVADRIGNVAIRAVCGDCGNLPMVLRESARVDSGPADNLHDGRRGDVVSKVARATVVEATITHRDDLPAAFEGPRGAAGARGDLGGAPPDKPRGGRVEEPPPGRRRDPECFLLLGEPRRQCEACAHLQWHCAEASLASWRDGRTQASSCEARSPLAHPQRARERQARLEPIEQLHREPALRLVSPQLSEFGRPGARGSSTLSSPAPTLGVRVPAAHSLSCGTTGASQARDESRRARSV